MLQDMYVYVDIAEGEDLRLGIRSGNMNADGSAGCSDCGWFKTDYFRIHKVDQSGTTAVVGDNVATAGVYDLYGRKVAADMSDTSLLPAGIYISGGRKFVKK